uniref:Orotate phosphoribosyltransferase n=2 Tax=Panagrolaimus sp. JU765 TaxID=591449 RepID=A0AC34PUD8_9BILA
MDSTLLREFYEKQVYKLGEFTLKSGIKSSIYIDLRVLISTPELLSETCKELVKVIKEGELQ